MFEYWKGGILGSGEMEKWVVGEIPFDMEIKNVHKGRNSLLKPTFQYSTIPLFQVCGKSKKPKQSLFNFGNL